MRYSVLLVLIISAFVYAQNRDTTGILPVREAKKEIAADTLAAKDTTKTKNLLEEELLKNISAYSKHIQIAIKYRMKYKS